MATTEGGRGEADDVSETRPFIDGLPMREKEAPERRAAGSTTTSIWADVDDVEARRMDDTYGAKGGIKDEPDEEGGEGESASDAL